jgi:hypothetical protein
MCPLEHFGQICDRAVTIRRFGISGTLMRFALPD